MNGVPLPLWLVVSPVINGQDLGGTTIELDDLLPDCACRNLGLGHGPCVFVAGSAGRTESSDQWRNGWCTRSTRAEAGLRSMMVDGRSPVQLSINRRQFYHGGWFTIKHGFWILDEGQTWFLDLRFGSPIVHVDIEEDRKQTLRFRSFANIPHSARTPAFPHVGEVKSWILGTSMRWFVCIIIARLLCIDLYDRGTSMHLPWLHDAYYDFPWLFGLFAANQDGKMRAGSGPGSDWQRCHLDTAGRLHTAGLLDDGTQTWSHMIIFFVHMRLRA